MTALVGPLAPGSVLGRYELLLPIAQGGMATVWAARMKGTRGFSKTLAIKTMLPALSRDPRFEKMFLAEAQIASRIRHPNVCEILDLGEQDGVLYIAMEWVEGEPLVSLLSECRSRERAIPHAIVARLILDAAKGLHAAHELSGDDGERYGLVHRDVSPHNILVTYDGLVKIVDFGVAKAVARSDDEETQAGHIAGKVHFMAPEQAFGDAIDRRTDIFALGIVLYQLVTGIHPFHASNDLATLARITSQEPVADPTTIDATCPPELAAVVMKALEKQPAKRFASMSELARELEAVVAKLAAAGEPSDVAAFVREVLGAKAAERATAIKKALRAAEGRTDQHALSGTASTSSMPPRSGEAFSPAPSGRPGPPGHAGAEASIDYAASNSMSPHGPAARRVATATGLIVLGAAIGAAVLIWASRAPGGASPSVAAAPGGREPAVAVVPPATPSALAEASQSASAAPPRLSAPVSSPTSSAAAITLPGAPPPRKVPLNPPLRRPDF